MQWEELLHLDFPDLKIVGDKFILNNNIINTGVKLSVENKDFVAILECNNCDKPYIYFGIGSHFVSDEKYATPESIVRILFEKQLLQPEDFWYGWKSTLVENAYADLKTLIHEIIKSN